MSCVSARTVRSRSSCPVWFDHEANEGGHFRDLYRLKHGAYPENGSDQSGFRIPAGMLRELGNPVAWWDYHDERGGVVGRVVRFHPPGRPPDEAGKPAKEFRQFRPDGAGWTPGLQGRKLPLYRLPPLLHAPAGSVVYLTEGEKHADALREWGLMATTNAGGAGKFRADHAQALVGHTVIVLGDNDEAGRKHVVGTMAKLQQAGVTAHTLELPNLRAKGDVVDWIGAGGTKVALERLTDAVIQPSPEADEEAAATGEPPLGAQEAEPEAGANAHSSLALWHWRARELEKPESLLGSVITNSSRTFIFGPTGLGKTHFALGMAACTVSGKGFGPWQASRQCRVLYVDGEMPRDLLQERLLDVPGGVQIRLRPAPLIGTRLPCPTRTSPRPAPPNTDDGRDFPTELD